ncbi:MAG: coat protein F [Clostridiales bacterium GWF2_36_10]|nr:MAG: coat protein F [Clostridiales bacterium GWF2_36_10]HAN20613.1 spore coat protein [Clostridiales bacterium]
MQLSQKETLLLKDLKEQEQICIEKYNHYASEAKDGQLKGMLTNIAKVEQKHYDTVTQIMNGTVPTTQSGGGNQQQQQTPPTFTPTYKAGINDQNKQKDSYLCIDLLSTEKHVSSLYNTAIFEFKDANVRQVLNHIQKEEQQHGEQIFEYMNQNGMYG